MIYFRENSSNFLQTTYVGGEHRNQIKYVNLHQITISPQKPKKPVPDDAFCTVVAMLLSFVVVASSVVAFDAVVSTIVAFDVVVTSVVAFVAVPAADVDVAVS